MVERLRAADRPVVARVIIAAAAISFGLELLLQALAGSLTLGVVVASLVVYPIAVAIFWVAGWWLGTRTWPKRGARLTRAVLRRRAADKKEIVFLSDRPDFEIRTPKRVWEVVGFSAGASVLFAAILLATGAASAPLATLGALMPVLTLWASFVLVPYWLTARLGLRIVDPVRWLILPFSRRYASRLRLSNGALLVLGAGAMFNLAFRTGADGIDAVTSALVYVLRIVAAILVVAAAAVAYYARDERGLVQKLEQEAVEMGIRDGRGMSDGDFLPRLPTTKG